MQSANNSLPLIDNSNPWLTNVFLIKKKEKEKRVKWSVSPPKNQRGQRISIHIYTKIFKRIVLSSPYLKSLNKLLKSLSHFEEEAAAELQFPPKPSSAPRPN